MPVVEDEVPEWKKELIRKKQMWKRSGGWSVPPVARSKTTEVRASDVGRVADRLDRPRSPRLDVVESNNIGADAGSAENLVFGSVSDLKTRFQPVDDDEVFTPLTKARSEENILDSPVVVDARRRSSTTSPQTFAYQNGYGIPKKSVNTVPKMEDFFRRYRKTTQKSVVAVPEIDATQRPPTETPRKKRSDTVYFVDINQNELPPPNTVKKTVKVFEEPVKIDQNSGKPDFDETTSSGDVAPEALPRARDVVQKFEEKIKSAERQAPPKPPRAGARKPKMPPKPAIVVSASDTQKRPKHVSFNTEIDDDGRTLNLVVQNDGATNLNTVHDDLKTVTINTNQSIIIKTV